MASTNRIVKFYRTRLPGNLVDDNYYLLGPSVIPYRDSYTAAGTAVPGSVITVSVSGKSAGTAVADSSGNWTLSFTPDLGKNILEATNAFTVYLSEGYFQNNTTNRLVFWTSRVYTILEMYRHALKEALEELNLVYDDVYLDTCRATNLYPHFGIFFGVPQGSWSASQYRDILKSLFRARVDAGTVAAVINGAWSLLGLSYNLNYTAEDGGDGTLMLKEPFDSLATMVSERNAFWDVNVDGEDDFAEENLVTNPVESGTGAALYRAIVDSAVYPVTITEGVNDTIDWVEWDSSGTTKLGTYSATVPAGVYTYYTLAQALQDAMNAAGGHFSFGVFYGGSVGAWATPTKIIYSQQTLDYEPSWVTPSHIYALSLFYRFSFVNMEGTGHKFSFLWKTGSNNYSTIGRVLGFDTSDDGYGPEKCLPTGPYLFWWSDSCVPRKEAVAYPLSGQFNREKGSAVFYLYKFAPWLVVDETNNYLEWTNVTTSLSYSVRLTEGHYSFQGLLEELVAKVNATDPSAALTAGISYTIDDNLFRSRKAYIYTSGDTLEFPLDASHEGNRNFFTLFGVDVDAYPIAQVTSSPGYANWTIVQGAQYFFEINHQMDFCYMDADGRLVFMLDSYTLLQDQVPGVPYEFLGFNLFVSTEDIIAAGLLNTDENALNVIAISWDLSEAANPVIDFYVNGTKVSNVTYHYPRGSSEYSPPSDDDLGGHIVIGNTSKKAAIFEYIDDVTYVPYVGGELVHPCNCIIDEFRLYNRVLTEDEHAILGRRPALVLGKTVVGWRLRDRAHTPTSWNSFNRPDYYAIDPDNYPDYRYCNRIRLYGRKFLGGGAYLDVYNPLNFEGQKALFESVLQLLCPSWLQLIVRYRGSGFSDW